MTYCLAIRRLTTETQPNPILVIKRGLTIQDARSKAETMNRTHMLECRSLGGECFVAYNEEAL